MCHFTVLPDVHLLCRGKANQFPSRPENEVPRRMISRYMSDHTFTPAYYRSPKLSFHPPNTMRRRADRIQGQGTRMMAQLQTELSLSFLVLRRYVGHWHSCSMCGRRGRGGDAIRFGNVPVSLCLNRAYVIMLFLFAPVQSVSSYCGL
jgi:hypothetical protein